MALLGVHRAIINFAKSDLIPVAAEERDRFHTRDEVGRNARAVIEALRAAAARAEAQAEYLIRQAMDKEQVRHRGKWTAVIGAQAKIDVSLLLRDDDLVDVLSVKSEQFNALIKNMSADLRAKIERETLGAIFEGRGNRDIAKAIEGIDGVGRRRARLIARDQASKLNGAMNQFRQEQAGVTHFRWKTILDGRERPEHHAKNGKVYPWAGPQEKPGQAINCRCRGIAILIDNEETAAQLVEPPPPEIDPQTFLADPSLELVSRTISQPVMTWGREALLIRSAEVRKVESMIEAAREAAAFTERDAANLFEIVFGFTTAGQDLQRMAGGGLSNSFASTRTLIFRAIKQRLATIAELLAHAINTSQD